MIIDVPALRIQIYRIYGVLLERRSQGFVGYNPSEISYVVVVQGCKGNSWAGVEKIATKKAIA